MNTTLKYVYLILFKDPAWHRVGVCWLFVYTSCIISKMSNQHSFIYSRTAKTLYLVTFPSTHIHVILPLFHSLHVCISIYSLMGLQKRLWIHQCPSLKRQQKDSFSILLILLDFLYCRFYVLNYLVSKWTRVT